jgi:hypothetical protein
MGSLISQQVLAGPRVTVRPRASWSDTPVMSGATSMSYAADMASHRDACAIANAAALGLAIHVTNGGKPFTRWPEERPT